MELIQTHKVQKVTLVLDHGSCVTLHMAVFPGSADMIVIITSFCVCARVCVLLFALSDLSIYAMGISASLNCTQVAAWVLGYISTVPQL